MNCWPSGKYVHLLYMYSKLGRGSFCFNYCLNSAWHGGDQFVALLRWYGSPVPLHGNFELRPLGVAIGERRQHDPCLKHTYIKTPPVGRQQPMTLLPARPRYKGCWENTSFAFTDCFVFEACILVRVQFSLYHGEH